MLTALNLRGVRESGTAFAVPTYCFMVVDHRHGAVGLFRISRSANLPQAESAEFDRSQAEPRYEHGLTGLAGAFLLLRAFSSGCAALTGVEAISNGVPAFKKPKSKNAATTLLLLGAHRGHDAAWRSSRWPTDAADVRRRRGPAADSTLLPTASRSSTARRTSQDPVIGQLAKAVFTDFPPGFYFVVAATGMILVLAANTAFNGFPVLGSILARDGYLPRQLHTRGDRLAFSNGIMMLAVVRRSC